MQWGNIEQTAKIHVINSLKGKLQTQIQTVYVEVSANYFAKLLFLQIRTTNLRNSYFNY